MIRWLSLVLVLVGTGFPALADRGGRLAPPDAVECDRNHLTSYEGIPLSVRSTPEEWSLTLRTDWGSEESFKVSTDHTQLVNGEPWDREGRADFIDRNGIPDDGLRVIAWVCEQPERVTLDWRPAAD